ncbi:MAG: hypothetical protein RI897_3010 [Verrucomicrobiota bacterium]
MVTSAGAFLEGGHASELGAPDYQRVFEEAALFQVTQEGGGGLVHDGAVLAVLFLEHLVSVPVADAFAAGLVGAIEELDEADAVFDEATGENTVSGIAGLEVFEWGAGFVGTVHFEDMPGFGGEVADFGDGELHAGGEFVAGDACSEFSIPRVVLQVVLVQLVEEVAGGFVGGGVDGCRAVEVTDGLGGAELGALEGGGEEAGSPVIDAGLRGAAGVGDGDVGGERFVVAAKGIGRPGADTGEAIEGEPGVHEILTGAVGVGVSGERVDEAHIIDQVGEVRDEVGNHFAALAAGSEFPGAFGEHTLFALEGDERVSARHGFAMVPDEFGFVVESIELAAGAGAEDHEDLFGGGGEVGWSGCVGVGGVDFGSDGVFPRGALALGIGEEAIGVEEVGEGDGAEAGARVAEEATSVEEGMRGDIHGGGGG